MIHLLFCHFKAVLEGLRARWPRSRLIHDEPIASILLLLKLVLVLGLLEDAEQLELLPELFLKREDFDLLLLQLACFCTSASACTRHERGLYDSILFWR